MSFDESKYKSKVPYPSKRDYFIYNVMSDEGDKLGSFDSPDKLVEAFGEDILKVCRTVHMKVEREDKASVIFGDYIVVIKFDVDAYKAHSEKYSKESTRIEKQFFNDCCEDHAVDPESEIASIIYSEAYQRGHSSGRSEVYNYFGDISDFADRIIDAHEKEKGS